MANPIGFITGAIKGAAALAQGLGKAKGIAERAMDDIDGNGIPEYQDIVDLLVKMFNRFKNDTLTLVKLEAGEYKKMINVLVPKIQTLVMHVFNDAHAKAKAGK